jgi:hypothetical protein
MIGRLRAWIRDRRAARSAEETRRRFAAVERRGPQQPDLLLDALRHAEPRRRRASRPLGAEPDDATRMAEAEDPLWVRRLDSQIVIMPTLPGSGAPERRADG